VAQCKSILAFLTRLLCQLLELRRRGLFVFEKESLPLPVDFQPIDIILVGPFAGVRKYAQLTRSHVLMVRILIQKRQHLATPKMLPSVARMKPEENQVQ
jgi:hypothetical protein